MPVGQVIVGVDPGVNGYIAVIHIDSGKIQVEKLGDVLTRDWSKLGNIHTVFLEKVQPRPSQALKGVVTSCVNYGKLKAAVHFNNLNAVWVTPQEWQKGLGLNKRWVRPSGLTDEEYSSWKYRERKKWHREVAKKHYPKANLSNSDAILIAYYGLDALLKC